MRGLATLMLILVVLSGCSPATPARVEEVIRKDPVHPFPEATAVRLFVESGKYDADGQPLLTRKAGRRLSPDERTQFEALLRVETPINVPPNSDYWMSTACFIPHHFFRYYDSAGRQVGEIAVCFCCGGIQMDPEASLDLHDKQRFEVDYGKLEGLIASWGEPTDIECS